MAEPVHETPPAAPPPPAVARRPFWYSRSLFVAAVFFVVGLGFWWKAPSTPAARPAAAGSAQLASSSAGGLGGVKQTLSRAPATFRFSASFIGGFFIGWAYRKSLKYALCLAALLIGGILLLKWAGAGAVDLGEMEHQATQGLEWLWHQAGTIKKMLSGALPSTSFALLGAFIGARHA